MLREIEDRLVKIIREKVAKVPGENVLANVVPENPKLPAVVISNIDFKFEKAGLDEKVDEGRNKLEEAFSGDSVKKSYKLREKPMRDSISVECPQGTLLSEKNDYVINYEEGSIAFRKIPGKGKNNIVVKYSSARIMILKSLKMKANFSIDVWGKDKNEADSIAGKVVKALLMVEDELSADGIGLKPVEGMVLGEHEGKPGKIHLKYEIEKALRVEQAITPMEKIEIKGKKI